MTAARLIRIGFPEWTVWMVPLAAGELGFIFADRYRDLDTEVIAAAFADVLTGRAGPDGSEGEPAIDEEELRAWVADAFATCVTGPAYVWAAMLLRADPTSAVDQRRVAVMVDVLELLASGLYDPDGNFVEVADRMARIGGWPWPRRTRAKDRSSPHGLPLSGGRSRARSSIGSVRR